MSDLEKAQEVVTKLEAKREACIRRGTELQDERATLAYSAHANNDAKAKTRLEEVHTAIATHASELASLDAALKAAADRLEKARQHETQKADRAAAGELRKELARFRELGGQLDVALAAVSTNGAALYECLGKIHALGSQFPTGQQLHSLGYRCLLTAIAATPWKREFETVAPRERRSFSDLIETWAATIESRLGEQSKENADAA
jgi:hypothetical protein